MKVVDLKLNSSDDDDDNDDGFNLNDHPRRLLRLVPSGELMAWGGDTGAIRMLESSILANKTDDVSSAFTSDTLIRPYDDDEDIRAAAVSHDGRRVALGMDTGCTMVFQLDTYVDEYADTKSKGEAPKPHPLMSDEGRPLPTAGPTFSAQIRDLQFHPLNHDMLAVASEEGLCLLHWTSVDGDATYTRHLEDLARQHHDGSGIRSVAFSSDGTTLASLAMDGRLCLWDVSSPSPDTWKLLHRSDERCVTKKDLGAFTGADAWDRSCRPQFLPNQSKDHGPYSLALPGATHVQLLDIANGNVTAFQAAGDASSPARGHIETIVAMATQNNKRNDKEIRLVTTGRDKRVILWIIARKTDGKLEASFVGQISELKSAPTDILWESDDTLLIVCANGSLVIAPATIASTPEEVPTVTTLENVSLPPTPIVRGNLNDLLAGLSDDESTTGAPLKKSTTSKTNQKKRTQDVDIVDSDDDLEDNTAASPAKSTDSSPSPAKAKTSRFVDDEAADAEDDNESTNVETFGGTKETAAPTNNQDHSDDDDDDFFDTNLPFKTSAVVQNLPEPQPAFAPSSSPLDLQRRFLCWNHIGAVTLRRDALGDRNTVDVNFTDSGVRRPISFTDNLGFVLGSLGEDGGIFATDLMDDDDDNDETLASNMLGLSEQTREALRKSQRKHDPNKPTGSSIFFHRFETFASLRDKDWHLTLPSGERALGCATGEGWAAVVTSRRFVRLFSSGGNQGQIFWLDGDPITIIGRSRFLAVFYHRSEPLRNGTQQIGFKLIDGMTSAILASGTTSGISSRASLSWAGFSNDSSLVILDSAGMTSMLVCAEDSPSPSSTWEWMPVLDTLGLKKSSDDSFWPVTVYDGKLVCVPLKGGTKFPDAARRPVTAALGFKLPLARGSLTKSIALEELSLRASVALRQKKVIQVLTVGEGDEDFDREYAALSAQVDKVTLKMFAATVEAGKLERALDLVERLHLEKSFELAMRIADSHRKLVDLIEDVKERKFPLYETDEAYDETASTSHYTDDMGHSRISPDGSSSRKRSLDDTEDRAVRQKSAYE